MNSFLISLMLCVTVIIFSCQNKNVLNQSVSTDKRDTVPLYDLKGNHVGDTVIIEKKDNNIKPSSIVQSSYLVNDTMKIYDSKGNHIRDTIINGHSK